MIGGSFVRGGFTLLPTATGSPLTEPWAFLPGGIALFEDRFGDEAPEEIADRAQQALDSIPKTLLAIRATARSST